MALKLLRNFRQRVESDVARELLGEIEALRSELREELNALRAELLSNRMSKAEDEPSPERLSIIERLLDSNERLTRDVVAAERERKERDRENRSQAQRERKERRWRKEDTSPEQKELQIQPELPAEMLACKACESIRRGEQPNVLDELHHNRKQHGVIFAAFLQPNGAMH